MNHDYLDDEFPHGERLHDGFGAGDFDHTYRGRMRGAYRYLPVHEDHPGGGSNTGADEERKEMKTIKSKPAVGFFKRMLSYARGIM